MRFLNLNTVRTFMTLISATIIEAAYTFKSPDVSPQSRAQRIIETARELEKHLRIRGPE